MSSKFQKKVEDFTCEHCHKEVKGDGFTNHCPHCLWSKHVDVNPGDRQSTCGGVMQPINFMSERTGYSLIHRCMKCGHEKKNQLSDKDDFDAAVKFAGRPILD